VNHYKPGEGITPHVDLLDRYGDGIIGICLASGCVMQFQRASKDPSKNTYTSRPAIEPTESRSDVYLPSGCVYVMSGEARYDWTHGIAGRERDWIEDETGSSNGVWVDRSLRVSITFRWLLPGADVVGGVLQS